MEKDRGSRIIALIALFIAVIGVSLGFASFSNDLVIQPAATVNAQESDFDVEFSTTDTKVTQGTVTATSVDAGSTITPSEAHINGLRTLTGVGGTFSEPGQKIEYSLYVYNEGKYDAYLNSVTFEQTGNKYVTCTAKAGTSQDLVDAACAGFKVTVSVNGDSSNTEAQPLTTSTSSADFSGHKLLQNKAEPLKVTVEYEASAPRADGDFTVKFGDITLTYSTVDND